MKLSQLLPLINAQSVPAELDLEAEVTPFLDEGPKRKITFYYISCERTKDGPPPYEKYYAVITDINEYANSHTNAILVRNARYAMAEVYRLAYGIDESSIKIIGVTGTNGKTTVTTIIYKALLNLGIKAGFIGTGIIEFCGKRINDELYSMTTPPASLLFRALSEMKTNGVEYCVMEVSSHALKQSRLGGLLFNIGIFTNLSPEHTDYHETMGDYFNSKLKLLKHSRLSIINVDDDYGLKAYTGHNGYKIAFGKKRRLGCYLIEGDDLGLGGSTFFIKRKSSITKVTTQLPTKYNQYNIGAAFLALVESGFTPKAVKEAVNRIDRIEGRMEIIHRNPMVIIDYAHTPKASSDLLFFINSAKRPWQKVFSVFGCGGNRDRSKRPEMGRIIMSGSCFSIITEDNSRSEPLDNIIEDILSGLGDLKSYTVIPEREEATKYSLKNASKDDIVLLIGKGHERYIIDSSGRRAFDERKIVERYYEQKNED